MLPSSNELQADHAKVRSTQRAPRGSITMSCCHASRKSGAEQEGRADEEAERAGEDGNDDGSAIDCAGHVE